MNTNDLDLKLDHLTGLVYYNKNHEAKNRRRGSNSTKLQNDKKRKEKSINDILINFPLI